MDKIIDLIQEREQIEAFQSDMQRLIKTISILLLSLFCGSMIIVSMVIQDFFGTIIFSGVVSIVISVFSYIRMSGLLGIKHEALLVQLARAKEKKEKEIDLINTALKQGNHSF
jgi:uncharacterized membrane protein (DUF485 family)